MKNIVVYQSSTGFTKQYANWIAEDLNCKAISIKDIKNENITEYDNVVFGGWIMGSGIFGYEKIKGMGVKNLIVFAVGASLDDEDVRKRIIDLNHLGETPFFYFPGGMQFDKLNFFIRFMLKRVRGSISKKKEKSKNDCYMERVIGTNFDNSDKKYIEGIVSLVKEKE